MGSLAEAEPGPAGPGEPSEPLAWPGARELMLCGDPSGDDWVTLGWSLELTGSLWEAHGVDLAIWDACL